MTVILLFNGFAFAHIFVTINRSQATITKQRSDGHTYNAVVFKPSVDSSRFQPPPSNSHAKFWTTFFLVLNFGLPWALYLLYINSWIFGQYGAYVFSIIFILLTGTQGVALFGEQFFRHWKENFDRSNDESILTSTTSARSSLENK